MVTILNVDMARCRQPIMLSGRESIEFTCAADIVLVKVVHNEVYFLLADQRQVAQRMSLTECERLLRPYGLFWRLRDNVLVNALHCRSCLLESRQVEFTLPESKAVTCSESGLKRLRDLPYPPSGQLLLPFPE